MSEEGSSFLPAHNSEYLDEKYWDERFQKVQLFAYSLRLFHKPVAVFDYTSLVQFWHRDSRNFPIGQHAYITIVALLAPMMTIPEQSALMTGSFNPI